MPGRQFSLAAELTPSILLGAAADADGRTSRYADLRNAIKAYVIAEVNQGNAATVEFTILQAKDTTGTGSKAVGNMPIWLCEDISTTDALIQQAPAANFTTDAAEKNKLVIFEILPEAVLDLANGFKTVAISTDASNAANITRAELLTLNQVAALGTSQPSTMS